MAAKELDPNGKVLAKAVIWGLPEIKLRRRAPAAANLLFWRT
jgi:hypothetical protein